MTTKHDAHQHAQDTKAESKPADKGEKIFDSLGQEAPAAELEKKNLKEAQERAAKEAEEAAKKEKS